MITGCPDNNVNRVTFVSERNFRLDSEDLRFSNKREPSQYPKSAHSMVVKDEYEISLLVGK